MKVYKERHLEYSFDIGSNWVYVKGEIKGRIYNGAIVKYRGKHYACEQMSATAEKKFEIIQRQKNDDDPNSVEIDVQKSIIYDKLKAKYSKEFDFPKTYIHVLTPKERKKGKYSRYFCEYMDEMIEISKKQFEYYGKNTTAYHEAVKVEEVELSLDVMELDINRVAINQAAQNIEGILNVLQPHDYMQIKEFMYTSGGQLEYENGDEYIGEYHIHPVQGPMEGPVHTSTKHNYLLWTEKQKYRPKGLV
jgi:hypothetical protein